jgi:hypothetical protein
MTETHGTPRPGTVLEAARIDFGACDFCNAVHINFFDVNNNVFATASLPIELEEAFIAKFKGCVSEIKARHAAPAMRQ